MSSSFRLGRICVFLQIIYLLQPLAPGSTLETAVAELVRAGLQDANENPQAWTIFAPIYGALVEQCKELKGFTFVAGPSLPTLTYYSCGLILILLSQAIMSLR